VSDNEDNNPTLRTWAPDGVAIKEEKQGLLSHHELMLRLDAYDPEPGVKIVGHRGYFLSGIGLRLNQAIINCTSSPPPIPIP